MKASRVFRHDTLQSKLINPSGPGKTIICLFRFEQYYACSADKCSADACTADACSAAEHVCKTF